MGIGTHSGIYSGLLFRTRRKGPIPRSANFPNCGEVWGAYPLAAHCSKIVKAAAATLFSVSIIHRIIVGKRSIHDDDAA